MAVVSGNILFVDDEPALSNALVRRLRARQPTLGLETATNADEALLKVKRHTPEAVVVDLTLDERIGPQSGLQLIDSILRQDSSIRILVLTGNDDETYGIEAINRGAASFNRKPIECDHLEALLTDAVRAARLQRRYLQLREEHSQLDAIPGLIAHAPEMKAIIKKILYASKVRQPTLLLGETGVGKGVIAQAIHELSAHQGPFVRFIPRLGSSDLVASELFGHEKGAFTGATEARRGLLESADKGTLFLDEVDELPPDTQVTLLDTLQERRFRRVGSNTERHSQFHLISATNTPRDQLMKPGKLREDFFHRVAHICIEIPPLRERREDILPLAEHFMRESANRDNLVVHGFSAHAEHALREYEWRGNIRELQARVVAATYAASFEERRMIGIQDLDFQSPSSTTDGLGSFRERVKHFEVNIVMQALRRHNFNQSEAARDLSMDRTQLRRIIARGEAAPSLPS